MRGILAIAFLFAFAPPAYSEPSRSCVSAIAQLPTERAAAERFANDRRTFPVSHEITAETVRLWEQHAERLFQSHRVRVDKYSPSRQKSLNLRSGLSHALALGQSLPVEAGETGALFRIRYLDDALIPTASGSLPFWAHRDAPATLFAMQQQGLELFADPTLAMQGVGGVLWVYDDRFTWITIGPIEPFATLRHELEHWYFLRRGAQALLESLQRDLESGVPLALQSTSKDPLLPFEPGWVETAVELLRLGYPIDVIDEHFAVQVEVRQWIADGDAPQSPMVLDRLAYTKNVLLRELAKLALQNPLPQPQRHLFLVTMAEILAADPDPRSKDFALDLQAAANYAKEYRQRNGADPAVDQLVEMARALAL